MSLTKYGHMVILGNYTNQIWAYVVNDVTWKIVPNFSGRFQDISFSMSQQRDWAWLSANATFFLNKRLVQNDVSVMIHCLLFVWITRTPYSFTWGGGSIYYFERRLPDSNRTHRPPQTLGRGFGEGALVIIMGKRCFVKGNWIPITWLLWLAIAVTIYHEACLCVVPLL